MLINLADVKTQLVSFTAWKVKPKSISKVFSFSGFPQALAFVNQVSAEAINMDHHPDIDIRFDKVLLTLSTHTEGGITQKDITLAKTVENVYLSHG